MVDAGRKAAALVAMLGGNAVPLVGLAGRGWPALDGMFMYLADNVLMVGVVALAVRLFAPPEAPGSGRRRSELVKTFFLVALPFSLGAAVFIIFFAALRHARPGPDFVWGLAAMAVFQIFGFVSAAGAVRAGGFPAAETLMEQTLGRIFLLSGAVYLGVGAALFVTEAFVVPFVILKTLVDLGRIPSIFRPKRTEPPTHATLN